MEIQASEIHVLTVLVYDWVESGGGLSKIHFIRHYFGFSISRSQKDGSDRASMVMSVKGEEGSYFSPSSGRWVKR